MSNEKKKHTHELNEPKKSKNLAKNLGIIWIFFRSFIIYHRKIGTYTKTKVSSSFQKCALKHMIHDVSWHTNWYTIIIFSHQFSMNNYFALLFFVLVLSLAPCFALLQKCGQNERNVFWWHGYLMEQNRKRTTLPQIFISNKFQLK